MKKVGLKYPVFALYSDLTGVPVYSSGTVMGKAMSAGLAWDKNDVKIFADDAVDEIDQTIVGGTETLALNELTHEIQSLLLGHIVNASGELIVAETDIAPYVGHGFYGRVKRNNTNKFRAVWLTKMQFAEPNDDTTTLGETIAFQTPTVSGEIMKDIIGQFKQEKLFDTEAEAKAWLEGKAGITAQCSTPSASVASGTYTSAQSVVLTAGVGEVIYYTINGLTPSATVGTVYSAAIAIADDTMLRAISTKEGSSNSAIAEYEYIITV